MLITGYGLFGRVTFAFGKKCTEPLLACCITVDMGPVKMADRTTCAWDEVHAAGKQTLRMWTAGWRKVWIMRFLYRSTVS
jgi:hypothetical protein